MAFGIHEGEILSTNLTDIDGNTYKTVTIGEQIWMAENLNVSKFRNGDVIPEAKTLKEWQNYGNQGKPAFCHYNFDNTNSKLHGKLYNWYVINDPRGIAPEGWEIPSNDMWKLLVEKIGGFEKKANSNEFELFNIKYSGQALSNKSKNMFYVINKSAFWWTSSASLSTPERTSFGWTINESEKVFIQTNLPNSQTGLSIRCIKTK